MTQGEKYALFDGLKTPREITVTVFSDMLSERHIYDIRTGAKKYRRSAPKYYYNSRWLIRLRSASGVSNADFVDTLKAARNAHGVGAIVYLDGVPVWG